MAHTVAVDQFEGPLGILLELVERGKLEVTAISVADITGQYLSHIQTLEEQSPEALGEFLGLGARLLYIKSLALLPQESTDEQGEELRRLNLELEDYRRFQTAARQLSKRTSQRTWERPVVERLAPKELPAPNITLNQLSEAFTATLQRLEPETKPTLIRHHLSLETKLAQLRALIPAGFELQTILEACADRLEIIITFLALLELIRDGAAQAVQTSAFAPIQVETPA